ncbi:MAG: CBS domain-containing protein, partial [Nitrospira sp.]|nr:CBS domain-containing protein [Nitrospira sp.]
KLMKTCNAEGVLVFERGRIVGIVTESDIVKKVIGSDRSPYFIPVEEIMSTPVVGIEERRPLTEAADLMNKHHSIHLGVTKNGAMVGILSVRDLLHPVSVDEF